MNNTMKRVQVIHLKLIREKSMLFSGRKVHKPDDTVQLFREFIGDCDRESFCILTLSTKNQPLALQQVSLGTLNSSILHPREVFKFSILSNAASIIACHNHPSGDPTPSSEDISMSIRLQKSGELLGIELLDHIILGQDGYVSMKERGLF
ncbi:DNA repair protein RadC [Paenibacillus sp. EKM202P]|uniref:JAB domain-containing protein n=1 Tax=Paenibacillus TaxID=44249 RepID=UPI001117DDBA|nr:MULTISPECIES: JAB domain-containing protein [Paenibacillus]KAF6558355.1 DNA repair protein RadC [Paenibacillus sp. EKM202P]KAF6563289.1 DNA repair protein RadC [Paenibacillus sp. EKM207P]QDA26749.1 DNA repair protein RadC [Paenibacillus polymyxa]WDM22301.1 DNA repair protein RadC [Paenibacillus polymyxa]